MTENDFQYCETVARKAHWWYFLNLVWQMEFPRCRHCIWSHKPQPIVQKRGCHSRNRSQAEGHSRRQIGGGKETSSDRWESIQHLPAFFYCCVLSNQLIFFTFLYSRNENDRGLEQGKIIDCIIIYSVHCYCLCM